MTGFHAHKMIEHTFTDKFGTLVLVRQKPEWSTIQLLLTMSDGEQFSYGFAPEDFARLARNAKALMTDMQKEAGA